VKLNIDDVRGLDGRGLAITISGRLGCWNWGPRIAFKTDGSATHWCWIEDGSPCPHEVWQAWEAYKVRNILAGKRAYECSNFTSCAVETPK
jgi:hypothetical protein